jgi:2-iminobutanoate/2-iminopropanoate deaminase
MAGELRRHAAVEGVPAPPGPFVWAVSWGGLVFVSGVRGLDPATGEPAPSDEARLELIFAHLDRILRSTGSSLDRVLVARVYVTDMVRHRPLVNAAFRRFFGENLPARTIVEVKALNQNDTVEVEVVAACKVKPSETNTGRPF